MKLLELAEKALANPGIIEDAEAPIGYRTDEEDAFDEAATPEAIIELYDEIKELKDEIEGMHEDAAGADI